MNATTYFFLALCAAALVWNLISSALIVQELSKVNVAKSIFVLRYLPWRYLQEYRKMTMSQTGKTGQLYYHYTLSILTVLLSALILALLLVL